MGEEGGVKRIDRQGMLSGDQWIEEEGGEGGKYREERVRMMVDDVGGRDKITDR
jgi:hypothetical protein